MILTNYVIKNVQLFDTNKHMILTNSTFLNSFLCGYNWHGKAPNSTAKK